jgi:pimeloyl-ACP methyl ester carboxylesterase
MATAVLAANAGPLFVAGHSMGGRVALEMVRQAPDRIRRLALLDTGFQPRKPGETAKRQQVIDLAYREGMKALAKQWLPPMVHPDRISDTNFMDRLTTMVVGMTPQIHERQIMALVNRPDATWLLGEIRCPTTLVVGRQDAWSPPEQHQEMQVLIPASRLEIVENAGHFAPCERPQETAEILRQWLADA